MFTGIIEELGKIKRISRQGKTALLEIIAERVSQDAKIGDSIAVNGVCLTVVKRENQTLSFEVIRETLALTNLGNVKIGEQVNLERSLRLGERLSGHFVTGHIDCVGVIRHKTYRSENLMFTVAAPKEYLRYIVPKGSVALDGISLTVVDKEPQQFSVYIIPHTLKNTTLGFKGPASKVNVECDILSKYTQR